MTRFDRLGIPWWFVAVIALMVAMQLVRLNQTTPGDWLLWDYVGRLTALAFLAAIPAARAVAFAYEQPKTDWLEMVFWALLLITTFIIVYFILGSLGPFAQKFRYGAYPHPDRWLYAIDMTIGLVLVAYHEEVVFRRCARVVLGKALGDGVAMVFASALLFGAYHWWSGIGNIVVAALFGAAAMLVYRRIGRLTPIVVAHYVVDVISFS
jgi:uncharacterized protein